MRRASVQNTCMSLRPLFVVRYKMRFLTAAVVISTLSLTCAYVPASGLNDSPTALAALQAQADQAQPRDRCFLYAELVSR